MPERPWQSPLFFAGIAVWLACLAAWAVAWAWSQRLGLAMAATFGTFFVGGKLAAIPLGLSLKVPPFIVGLIVLLPDVGAVLLGYPLTRGGLKLLGRWSRFVRRLHRNAERAAHRREGFVARYGAWGLFLMALLPVGFYSPLVISAIGQIMGLGAGRVIIPVVGGMTVMTVVWVMGLGASVTFLESIDPRLPYVFSIGMLVLFVGLAIFHRFFGPSDEEDEEAEKKPEG